MNDPWVTKVILVEIERLPPSRSTITTANRCPPPKRLAEAEHPFLLTALETGPPPGPVS